MLPVTELPQRILTLPAAYLSDSLIFWEQKPLGQSGFPGLGCETDELLFAH